MERRADFIWLADQPVDHGAAFATLRGAPLRRVSDGQNRWILARGRFHLDSVPTSARAAITVDGRYKLWINGSRIGFGPPRSSPWSQRIDHYEVAGSLHRGTNVVSVLIHVPGIDLAWYETVKGNWQPTFGDGGLYFHLEEEGGRLLTASNEQWRMVESAAWSRDTPQAGWGQDFIEDFDARALDPGWTASGFNDSGWPAARPMVSKGDEVQAAKGWGRVEAFPALVLSSIPPPAETVVRAKRLVWVRPVMPRPELPLQRRLYSEALGAQESRLLTGGESLLRAAGGAVVHTEDGRDTALLLAFDPYHVGRPFIDVEAQGGEVIEIACAEALPGEFGRGSAGDGLRLEGHLGCANVSRYTARPGRQRFEKFGWTAVRAMQIVVRNAPDGLRIRDLGSVATHYPAEARGSFSCSDPHLTKLWQVARHTLLQCMHDAWIDCPGREARQWVGDAVVEFDAAVPAFGPSLFPLQSQFLMHAMEGQRADGLLRMFGPGDIAPDAVTIPDYSLLWIIGAARYLLQSEDVETAAEIMPGVERALAWFERLRTPGGLVADLPQWHFIEWAHVDRRGFSAPINALFAGALAAAADLARSCRRFDLARQWRDRARTIASALNRTHWNERRAAYVDSVDPRTGAQRPRISQHANGLMLLFGLAPPRRARRLIQPIIDAARLKLTAAPPIVPEGEPFDEETDVVRANTFFSHFVYDGLARAGRFDWVLTDMRRAFGPMLDAGATTLWESFAPAASLCHGFSATPLHQLSTHGLGIRPIESGYRRFAVAPQPGDIEWAQGIVPTMRGDIEVKWHREADGLCVVVTHPQDCRPEAGKVPGLALASSDAETGRIRLRYERLP